MVSCGGLDLRNVRELMIGCQLVESWKSLVIKVVEEAENRGKNVFRII